MVNAVVGVNHIIWLFMLLLNSCLRLVVLLNSSMVKFEVLLVLLGNFCLFGWLFLLGNVFFGLLVFLGLFDSLLVMRLSLL